MVSAKPPANPELRMLNVGVATPVEMRARTLAIARGTLKPGPNDPTIWVPSFEALGRILTVRNTALLDRIRAHRPASITELSRDIDRAPSNVLRTLRTMERYGLVALHRGIGKVVRPEVTFDDLTVRRPRMDTTPT